MSFPQLKNKHLEEALFNPEDFGSYKRWKKNTFPSKMILCCHRAPHAYFKRHYKGKYEIMNVYKNQEILRMGNIGFMRLRGIGAPNAVTFMEELIAHGTKEFINMGIAGGLSQTGVFLCDKAIRDEGVSHHYLPNGMYSYPDEQLTKRLARHLGIAGIDYQVGSTWTIDAPYRETKKEISIYKKKGIKTVEMEASALFAVAKVKRAKIASMFVVSDVLGEKWDPQFHKIDVKKTLNKLVDASVECLKGK
jgi:uridine phosphorylase